MAAKRIRTAVLRTVKLNMVRFPEVDHRERFHLGLSRFLQTLVNWTITLTLVNWTGYSDISESRVYSDVA
jgi:hypothetical protein